MKTLLLILSLLLITTNAYADNKRLHCNGKEELTDFTDYKKISINRDFIIDFNEKNNYLYWNANDFSMCYINPFNKIEIIKSETRFSKESITYECETDGIPSTGKYTGQVILDRYTGVMKISQVSYRKISEQGDEKIVSHKVGNFTCDLIVNKKF